ncbi:MAG: hypothetical protein ABEJ87_01810 [Candidatus Nanohalobium sp.]
MDEVFPAERVKLSRSAYEDALDYFGVDGSDDFDRGEPYGSFLGAVSAFAFGEDELVSPYDVDSSLTAEEAVYSAEQFQKVYRDDSLFEGGFKGRLPVSFVPVIIEGGHEFGGLETRREVKDLLWKKAISVLDGDGQDIMESSQGNGNLFALSGAGVYQGSGEVVDYYNQGLEDL